MRCRVGDGLPSVDNGQPGLLDGQREQEQEQRTAWLRLQANATPLLGANSCAQMATAYCGSTMLLLVLLVLMLLLLLPLLLLLLMLLIFCSTRDSP